MATESDLLALIDLIYAAAYEPERWRDYALALRESAGADSVSLMLHSPREQNSAILTELTTSARQQEIYGAYFNRTDRWRQASYGIPPDSMWLSHEHIGDDEMAESEFYRDFLRHNDTPLFYFAGGAVGGGGASEIICGILRERAHGPFGEAERRLMQMLKPHMQRAIGIDRRLRQLRQERDAVGALAERMNFGVVLLDQRGRILSMNAAAAEILASGDGLSIAQGITALRGNDDQRLQALILAAIGGNGGTMALERPSGRRAYWLLAGPAPNDGARSLWGGEDPAAILFITDPERRPAIAADALERQYGLTPQEARVAVGLAEGLSMADIADRLAIARATAETHLKRGMRKLKVHSRGELIALLLRGGAPLVQAG